MNSKRIKIDKLDELVQKHLSKDQKIVKTDITRLTAPGENFGSAIYKVDVLVKDNSKKNETISMVAKMIPEEEFLQEIFNIQVSFRMETAFYETIVPTLQEFQREQGVLDVIDFFPRFYGSRANLDGGPKVDKDAILLVGNLKPAGYDNLDRLVGCDLEAAKFILTDLAKFHAVPLALKLIKPAIFEIRLQKYMACFNPMTYPREDPTFDNAMCDIFAENEDCKPFIPMYRKSVELDKKKRTAYREPFATLSHGDMWVNNFMVIMEKSKILKNKFVDFQGFSYESPVRDLLFFLFTSVQERVLKTHLDSLLKVYHSQFIKTLEEHRCQTKDFSFDNFMDEIYYYGIYEISHITFFLIMVVFGKKGDVPDMDFSAERYKNRTPKEVLDRTCWTLAEFGRRKWLRNSEKYSS